MPFLIDATDRADSDDVRAAARPTHLAYLEDNLPILLAAGAKLSDDGESAFGSLYLLDVDDREAAQAFIDADPFSTSGLFESVTICRWRKGFFDHARLPSG